MDTGAYGAVALRRDARALQEGLGALLPDEESLDEAQEDGAAAAKFRASLRPDFAALTVALDLLNLESPADARTLDLAGAGLGRGDLAAVLARRRDFDAAAVRAAVDAAPLDEGRKLFPPGS